MERDSLVKRINALKDQHFLPLALDIFHYQATNNPLYAQFLDLLGIKQAQVQRLEHIPFLPIELFKKYKIQTGHWDPTLVFTSSGTTGSATSHHLLRDRTFYRENARRAFEHFYGKLDHQVILALLPAYLEREGSSLIFMVEDFIEQSDPEQGGFFLYNEADLLARIAAIQARNQTLAAPLRKQIIVLGVSFALLDLAENHPGTLADVIIMETGGMKGRRAELTRPELHEVLGKAFGQENIHSEYGMTELLSQAYSPGKGVFYPAPTMRVLTREITDPLALTTTARSGVMNIIDLANLDTISFIATEDIGKVYADGSFEILGRLDAGDVRGCNLLVE